MKISNLVEKILSESQDARDSDKVLMLKVMEHYGLYLSPHQQQVYKDMPSTETVRRVRQKLQEGGKYQADPRVAKERHYKGMRMQQYGPKLRAGDIERIILPWGEGRTKK